MVYVKKKIHENGTNNNNTHIRDFYRRINYFRNVSQPTITSVKTSRVKNSEDLKVQLQCVQSLKSRIIKAI
jgi:hypothetical protein